MADKKISALTASVTPLAGTEVLPIVQSGATVKVAVSDLTAGRAISATQVTVSANNIIMGTANKGIDFSANTHAAGMTSELLNDYEEGNWTPVLQRETGGAITASYNTQTGKYVKIGNLVTVTGFIDVASVSAQGSGPNGIIGLPYNPANNSLDAGSVARNNAFTTDVVHSCFGWSDGRILFSSNVNSNAATAVDWKAGFINFTFSYFV